MKKQEQRGCFRIVGVKHVNGMEFNIFSWNIIKLSEFKIFLNKTCEIIKIFE